MQANWTLEDSVKEVLWVHEQHERTGWPHAIVGSADLFVADAIETIEAELEASPLLRGIRLQLHWHDRNEAYRFATGPDRASDRTFNENLAKLSALGLVFELQVFPNQLESALELVGAPPRPDVRADPRGHADRRRAVARRAHRSSPAPERHGQALGPGHVRPRVDPERIADVTEVVLDTLRLRAARCSGPTSRSKACGPTSLA